MSTSERRWRGVEHDVHGTRLTGAMVARTCGAHQGAGATLTCFEASGGLRSANEERGETRDEDEDEVRRRRGSRGEASDDGAARTKASWWRWYHVRPSRSRARAAGHGVGFRAQRSDYPYSSSGNISPAIFPKIRTEFQNSGHNFLDTYKLFTAMNGRKQSRQCLPCLKYIGISGFPC